MTSDEVEAAVKRMYCWKSMLWMPQMRVGSGFGEDGERTMDLWGIQVSRPNVRVTVEIEVTRSDFRRDVANRMKQRRARMLANEFYYAAPSGLLTPDDVPQWSGLIEIRDAATTHGDAECCHGHTLYGHVLVPAPWFDSSAPTWRFVASLARRIAKEEAKP